ncbi:MAG: hypothetical protein ACI4DS_00835 [Eubacterium sp.]
MGRYLLGCPGQRDGGGFMIRRRAMMAVRDEMPAGYTRLCCLAGAGNNRTYFVIPQIDITNHPYVLFEVAFPMYTNDTNTFGSILNEIRFEHGIGWHGSCFSYNYGSGYGTSNYPSPPNAQTSSGVTLASSLWNKRLLFEYKEDTFYMNGIEQTIARSQMYASGNFGIAKNVFIFGTNRGETKRYFSGKIYRFYVEGQIDLVPSLDRAGVPCMYDTISKTTFYNSGIGTFGYETMDGTYVAPV